MAGFFAHAHTDLYRLPFELLIHLHRMICRGCKFIWCGMTSLRHRESIKRSSCCFPKWKVNLGAFDMGTIKQNYPSPPKFLISTLGFAPSTPMLEVNIDTYKEQGLFSRGPGALEHPPSGESSLPVFSLKSSFSRNVVCLTMGQSPSHSLAYCTSCHKSKVVKTHLCHPDLLGGRARYKEKQCRPRL